MLQYTNVMDLNDLPETNNIYFVNIMQKCSGIQIISVQNTPGVFYIAKY